jgi:NET1-associated nuclear protein 1 (U3 small nucleolar RNA-associated protein 17)
MYAKTPALSNLLNKNQIFLAVPAPQQGSHEKAWYTAAPFVQTYDLSTGRHVARQAFARNNVTNINIAPDAAKISESNIVHMQASMDARWLATAEHWTPPDVDVKYLATERADEQAERTQRRETYIKFWHWNESKEQWVLEARIDSPHQSETVPSANRILDLVADPKSIGFASTGEDGIVRIWRPKTKLRDGTVVRGARQDGLITWLCSQAIEVERTIPDSEPDHDIQFHGIPKVAKLAFSDDASLLAISQDGLEPIWKGIVHFVDTDTGLVKRSQSRMYLSGLAGLQFMDRYLVVLSDDIQVWDVVTCTLMYDYPLQLPDLLPVEIRATTHLAVSTSHDRFAVAHAILDDSIDNETRVRARLIVLGPTNPHPLLKVDLPNVVTSIIPIHGSPGFAIIDSAAEIRTVKPSTAATIDIERIGLVANSKLQSESVEAEDIEMADEEEPEEPDAIEQGSDVDMDEGDKPVVRPEQLAEVFDVAPSFALPSVQELFHAVAGLYAQKPPVRATGS